MKKYSSSFGTCPMQGLAKQLCFRADHKRKEAEELICPTHFCFLISFRVCTMASHLCPVYQRNEIKIKSRVTLEGKIISQMCKTQKCSHKIEGENCSALFLVLNLKSYFCVAQFWGFWVCVCVRERTKYIPPSSPKLLFRRMEIIICLW